MTYNAEINTGIPPGVSTTRRGSLYNATVNIFRDPVGLPATKEARVIKIVNDIVFCSQGRGPGYGAGSVYCNIWNALLDVVIEVPHNHEWIECLVLALHVVSLQKGGYDEDINHRWSQLPYLDHCLRRHFDLGAIWLEAEEELYDEGDETMEKQSGSGRSTAACDSVDSWKSINAIAARLVGRVPVPLIYLGIWRIREVLEEQLPTEPSAARRLDCCIWVAAEWIIHAQESLLEELRAPNGDLDAARAESRRTGALYSKSGGRDPRSMQRWTFWEARLAEILQQAESLGIRDETKRLVEEALRVMA